MCKTNQRTGENKLHIQFLSHFAPGSNFPSKHFFHCEPLENLIQCAAHPRRHAPASHAPPTSHPLTSAKRPQPIDPVQQARGVNERRGSRHAGKCRARDSDLRTPGVHANKAEAVAVKSSLGPRRLQSPCLPFRRWSLLPLRAFIALGSQLVGRRRRAGRSRRFKFASALNRRTSLLHPECAFMHTHRDDLPTVETTGENARKLQSIRFLFSRYIYRLL
jgi:hypothetical protein